MGPFLAWTDETCQESFPPFCLHQTSSDQQRGSVCCVGMGPEKGLLCCPAPKLAGGWASPSKPALAENVAKSPIRGAAGKATCSFSGPGLCRTAGWSHTACRAAPTSALHWALFVQGDLLALPRVLCLMARGEVLEAGKVHAWSCRGGWCSGVPQKEPYQAATA